MKTRCFELLVGFIVVASPVSASFTISTLNGGGTSSGPFPTIFWTADCQTRRNSGPERPGGPYPVADLRKVLPILPNVFPVLHQLVLEPLLEVDPLVAHNRQAVNGVDHQMETVDVV